MSAGEPTEPAVNALSDAHQRLSAASCHVQNRAWAGLYNFLTANSILVLGWATLFVGNERSDASFVLLGISGIGIATGLAWALLGIRTWEWTLRLDAPARSIQTKVAMLAPFAKAAKEIHERWYVDKDEGGRVLWERRLIGLSSNPWVLFLAPILLAFLHMAMLSVVAGEQLGKWRWLISVSDSSPCLVLIVGWIVFVLVVWRTWKQCSAVLYWKHEDETRE